MILHVLLRICEEMIQFDKYFSTGLKPTPSHRLTTAGWYFHMTSQDEWAQISQQQLRADNVCFGSEALKKKENQFGPPRIEENIFC